MRPAESNVTDYYVDTGSLSADHAARRILPATKAGAWEVVGRYSHVDITDQLVDGGIMDRGTNWWATRRWKIGFDYGVINLDRDGLNGLTHAFHTRFQWAF